jgi:hypothetical protein
MLNNFTNINKSDIYLSPQIVEQKEKTWNMTLEIQILVWDRYKHVTD